MPRNAESRTERPECRTRPRNEDDGDEGWRERGNEDERSEREGGEENERSERGQGEEIEERFSAFCFSLSTRMAARPFCGRKWLVGGGKYPPGFCSEFVYSIRIEYTKIQTR